MTPTTYLIKFNADGQRESTLPVDSTITAEKKAELIAQGYIEVPAAEWQEYCNGKIRGEDGKPVDPPPYVPTKEEKLAALDAQYDADKAEIMRYFATAVFAEDADAQADLRAEMAAIDAQYETDRADIEQEAD